MLWSDKLECFFGRHVQLSLNISGKGLGPASYSFTLKDMIKKLRGKTHQLFIAGNHKLQVKFFIRSGLNVVIFMAAILGCL
jgi:hypothetical protein